MDYEQTILRLGFDKEGGTWLGTTAHIRLALICLAAPMEFLCCQLEAYGAHDQK